MQQQNSSQNSPFQGYTVKELRLLAKECKIKYYYKFKKLDLILALENNQKNVNPTNLSITNTKKNKKTKKTNLSITNTKKINTNTQKNDTNNLNNKTVKELRYIAKNLKIKYYYKLKKLDLVNTITNTQKNSNPTNLSITNTKKIDTNTKKNDTNNLNNKTIKNLRDITKNNKI